MRAGEGPTRITRRPTFLTRRSTASRRKIAMSTGALTAAEGEPQNCPICSRKNDDLTRKDGRTSKV